MHLITERGQQFHGREWYHTNQNVGKKRLVIRDTHTIVHPCIELLEENYHLVPGHEPCNLYITWQDVMFSRGDLGRSKNSLVVEHGCWAIMDYLPPSSKPLICNNIAVYGEGDADLMSRVAGISDDRIHITGMPAMDFYIDRNTEDDKSELFKTLELPVPQGPIIGYLPSHDCTKRPYGHYEILAELKQLMQRHPDWTLLIKHYANEFSVFEAQDWSTIDNAICLNGAGWNQAKSFNCMDVVLCLHHGTAPLKAMALGKPIISLYQNSPRETGTFEVWHVEPYLDYVKEGLDDAAIELAHMANVDQIEDVITRNLDNPTIRLNDQLIHAAKWLGPLDGRSRERMVALIDKLTEPPWQYS